MSSSSKVVMWIIVVLVIIIGGFVYFTHESDTNTYLNGAQQATTTDNGMNGIPPRNDDGLVAPSATDTSNTTIDATTTLDSQ